MCSFAIVIYNCSIFAIIYLNSFNMQTETSKKVIKLTRFFTKAKMAKMMEISIHTFDKRLQDNAWLNYQQRLVSKWSEDVEKIVRSFDGNIERMFIERPEMGEDIISAVVKVDAKKIPTLNEQG
jgi:hypothetical protein